MDYLRNLGSAAVSTLVQKSGLNLPFSLGPKVASLDGICSLYDATKRDDSTLVSVFEYDFSQRRDLAPLAKNSLRKLRTIRHPDVLKFMDAVESDTTILIMTERVRPLDTVLQAWTSKGVQEKEDWIIWGLHRISVALAFINDSCASTHGAIRTKAVFLSLTGEWKLGGFEVLSNPNDDAAVLYSLGSLLPDNMSWAPPEVKKGGWSTLKQENPPAADAYALGLLVNATFNPDHHPPATASPPHPPPAAVSRGNMPNAVFPMYKKLLNPNPKGRLTAKGFLEIGMSDSSFFASNRLVKVCSGLDNFALASESEKLILLRTLHDSVDSFPSEFATDRVLPSLVSALEYGGASAATIVPLVLRIGTNVSDDKYESAIITPVVKLFASPDRGIRMALLDHLPEYADKLDKKTVDGKIFPHLQTGFSDTVAVIREATVKSISLIAPKLSDRNLNNDLLRFLAKMQQDPEASIRTNTCILIGRLGPTLGYNTKKKVLVPAFLRALKDPFVHARVAGLMAFMATIDCFDVEDLATKVIPNMSFALVDKEKLVRDQAFKTMELFIKKLENYVATLPETATPNPLDQFSDPVAAASQGTLVTSAAGAAGALAGWAMSSIGKRLAASDMQTTMAPSTATSLDRPTSAPPPAEDTRIGNLRPSPLLTSISAANSTVTSPALPIRPSFQSSSKTKGMQLGASKVPSSIAAALAETLADEVSIEDHGLEASNPWGDDDLMDVNADEGDWSAFESAPAPVPVTVTPAVVAPKPVSASTRFGSNGFGSATSAPKSRTPVPSMSNKTSSTISPSSSTNGWDQGDAWDTPSTAQRSTSPATPIPTSTMTKEEKAAEMARRKEERKQRIAMLKEQKKHATQS
ncbi:armadillo-type protein [Lentinula raphanica]|uniref:Armadillo-type protein n=1 Tax=Lentinula raphanica TaxID=153919 RepID=A0AA38PG95_9AGAR|nr:armadillo-type protein [Lentinula raphanica]KAJ3975414.1 armadillo-type protein [Lentinula raphanica]